jgi:NAD(P)-dependent dehydrogenase (short-subunit alcohol dehydrogenase family)
MNTFQQLKDHLLLKVPLTEEEASEILSCFTPIKRLGSSKEVVAAALYLSTEDSAFMIGAELLLDGGLRSL